MRHLDLLNVFLALRFRQPGYPTCLERLGYSVDSIGVKGVLDDGTQVHPDVIASARERGTTLLVEVKGGAQIDGDQLRRMLRVTAIDLRDRFYLYIPDPAAHRIQVVYVCDEAHRPVIAEQLDGKPAAMISFDGSHFRLFGQPLDDTNLASCLTRAQVRPDTIPLAIIPFDDESPDGDVARALLPQILNAWVQGSSAVRPEDLVAQTHRVVHSQMQSTSSGSELGRLAQRAKRVLEALTKGELSEWLVRVPSQPPQWRFRKQLPVDAGRTRELQKLQRAALAYLESVGGGHHVQLELFSDAPPADD